MVVGVDPTAVPAPASGSASKREVVRELGELALLLPSMVNQALEANDRAKYYLTLLQACAAGARLPGHPTPSLHRERLAAGINEAWLDQVVESSEPSDDDHAFVLPRVNEAHDALMSAVGEMLTPFGIAEVEDSPDPARLERLRVRAPDFAGDRVPYDYVERATSADRAVGDSLHLLVMDGHRALNRLQAEIATEILEGASVYGVDDDDRELIAAFMSGLRRTAPLKFDHPGLGTTATHVRGRLLIQNDIGMTEAHVLVVAVEGLVATVTYTDVHRPRLTFFEDMLDTFDVDWSRDGTSRRRPRIGSAPFGDWPVCGVRSRRARRLHRPPGFQARVPHRLESGTQTAGSTRRQADRALTLLAWAAAAEKFGQRVRARRHELGLTLEQLAERADMHWTYVGSIERGTRNPTLRNILRLAAALKTDPADLVRGLR